MVNKQVSTLAKNIRKLRQEKGWSQDELARKANIPFTTLTKIETGVIKKPSVFTVEQIAEALGVSIDQIIR
jgi:transcriptional regulator with XRE-family HTH domain